FAHGLGLAQLLDTPAHLVYPFGACLAKLRLLGIRMITYLWSKSQLVVNHSDYDGYIRFSFSRAIAVVKRQLTVALAAFRRCSQAADFRRTVEMAGMR